MLLPVILATTLLELRTVDLGAVFGWYPPGWGSTPSEVRTDYPGLVPHTGHFDPDAGPPSPASLHVHEPVVWIAGSRPRYLDFEFAPWGLEGVGIEYAQRGTPALYALGPPSCVGEVGVLWRRRNAVIAVTGLSVFVAEPGSQTAAMLERFACSDEWHGRSADSSEQRAALTFLRRSCAVRSR